MSSTSELRSIGSLLSEHFSGAWGSDPSLTLPNATVLRSTDIDDEGHVDLSRGARRHLSPRELSSRQLRPGDILLEASGGGPGKPVGRPAWFSDVPTAGRYATSNFFKVLRADVRSVDAKFLLYALVLLVKRPEIWRFQQQTTGITNLKFSEYLKHEIVIPPLMEQRRIVGILDTLDDQIRSTDLIIQKLRTTRIAFVSTLLRVDGNGTWRGDWPLRPLRSIITGIDAGKSPDCPDLPASAGEWGVLKVSAVGSDSFRPSENKKIPLSIRVDARSAVHLGDLLMTRANTPDLVGMACVVDRSFDSRLVLSDKTWRINPSARLDRDFLVEVLRALPTRRYIQNLATGTSGSMKNFSQRALLDMLVPVPELIEQRHSSGRLGALTARVAAEQAALDKLKATKAGLVSDLLAGRVRAQPESAS